MVEAEKSEQGLERRKKAQQGHAQRKKQRKKLNDELRSFLRFVVSGDEKARLALNMMGCDFLCKRAIIREFVTFQDGLSSAAKVDQLLKMFDTLKHDLLLCHLIQAWIHEAAGADLYVIQSEPAIQPEPNANNSPSRSEVSGLTPKSSDGSLETVSLSSHSIIDGTLNAIIEAGVFAAFAVEMRRKRTFKKIYMDFSKIFRIGQPEYSVAMAKAIEKEEWPASGVSSGNNSVCSDDSNSNNTFMDEAASAAYTAVGEKAEKCALAQTQIDALYKYCFIKLQRHETGGSI